MLVYLVIVLTLLINVGNCAKILGIVPTPSYSHQVVFQSLFRQLSLRGHDLTVLTTDPMKDPKLTNLTEIDLHFSYVLWNKHIMENVLKFNSHKMEVIFNWIGIMIKLQDEQLRHPSVQKLIKGEERFDLIIIEAVMPAMFAFVEKFKCPFIAMLSLDAPEDLYRLMGNPSHPVLNPDLHIPLNYPLTFGQRITVVLSTLMLKFFKIYNFYLQDHLVKLHFGNNFPQLEDIMKNPDMLFLNTDPIFYQVRPLVPTIVQMGGGSHLKPQKPLPTELKSVLDNATNGFIYFSLGTNVRSKDIPLKTRNAILSTFSQLPFTILWKFEADNLPNKPENVIISPWFPQQDVLRHQNIKLFITQGGVQSLDETMYSGVPIVIMPFFGDQEANAKRMEAKGVGLTVHYTTLTEEEFKQAILEVAQNPRYRNKIKELANLARDQPMTGLERAVWWTEYVLRHNGTAHLRSPLLDVPWYQYLLLDVLAAILGGCFVVFYVCYRLVRYVCLCMKRKQKKSNKKSE